MARKYDLRKRAEGYYERAQKAEKSSSLKKEGPTHGEVSRLYEQAGGIFAQAGDYNLAYENLKRASRIAYDNTVKRRIEEKIRKLPSKGRKIKPGRLERRLGLAIAAMISLVGALFFSVFSLTGSVIQGLNENNSRWIGIILFVVGLVFTFLYNRTKK